ncbi:MAG: hypothetical protein CL793_07595 [Chloroflexi bacterium]|nr:hypothetical protein [Chloroflexota bacterium]|tara:strand:- start:5513 stop:5701 length:189 start_codon:yes stop_codon:yes gene_type:complete
MDIINTILGLDWKQIVEAILTIVGGFSILATLTPNTSDDRWIQAALDWINRCALLIGRARIG